MRAAVDYYLEHFAAERHECKLRGRGTGGQLRPGRAFKPLTPIPKTFRSLDKVDRASSQQ